MMRLCFGTLCRILRLCKLPSVTDTQLLGALTKTIDDSSEYGASDGTAVSRLLSCSQNLSNGQKRRVGTEYSNEHQEYRMGYGTNRLSDIVFLAQRANQSIIAGKIQELVIPMLDDDRKPGIVPCLIGVINDDASIDVEKHMSFVRFFGESKADILNRKSFVLCDFLARALLYTVVSVKNTEGKSCAKIVDERFFVEHSKHSSDYEIAYTLIDESSPVLDRPDEAFIPTVREEIDRTIIDQYITKATRKYCEIKTLLYADQPKPFYSFYVCNNIIRRTPVQGKVATSYVSKTISDVSSRALAECSRFVILTGTGGLGKSMMMRHLLLDALENYTSTQVLPLFISLKDYGETYTNLYNYLLSKIDGFGVGLTDSDFSSMLISGHLLLLLDGLDEVSTKHTATFEKQLEQFTDRYPDNRYVLSSRPYRSFVSYARFSVLYLQPFTKAQALALIDKLEFRPDMPEIKEKFRDELDRTLFRSHYEFSTNPLLLTIMLMTFEQFAEVPSKMHVFYRKAFDTLAQQHDASKGGFRRAFRTGLSVDRFAEYFAEFCSRTYYDEKFELTETEFTHYFNTLNEKRKDDGLRLSAANFIYDICTNMCLMYFEAGKYHFTHRSFQEYFCALYFSKQKDKNLKAIGEFFEKRRSRNYGDKTFDMLYDMIPEKIEEYVFLPFLTDLLSECDKADGYWTFLELMYPQLCYEYGETAECINNAPASYLYEFAMMIFFGEACDITSFPFDDSLVVDSYVSVEDAAGNADIVNERDVSYEYKCEYGSPEPVGWVLELDIAKLRSDTAVYSGYIQRLDDEDFCLKREYTAMRNYIAKLTSKQKPKSSSNLFDLFA